MSPVMWILFHGETKPVRLDQLSFVQEMMLENGRPHSYVPPPDQGGDAPGGPGSDNEDGSDGWDVVAEGDVNQVETMASQIIDASGLDSGDEVEVCSSPSGNSADSEAVAADVFARVKRFQESLDRGDCGAEDPFWLGHFFDIMEKLEETPGRPVPMSAGANYQFPLTILSGCTGLAAEGWVCKAGHLSYHSFMCRFVALFDRNFTLNNICKM